MIEDFDYDAVLRGVLDDVELSAGYVSDIKERTKYNGNLADYFIQRYEETGEDKYFARSCAVGGCGQSMLFDMHRKKRIADLIRLQLCHDRYCLNCAKMRQATYLQRFMPHILATSDEKDIYHMVCTCPNVSDVYLRSYVTIFYKAFARLIEFLKGKEKIHGIDFAPLGYVAALRNTEITYLRKDYHLHIHAIFAVNKGLYMPKVYTNKFSYSRETDERTGKNVWVHKRYFSAFEIFLQKLWRLLVDQIATNTFKFGLRFTDPLPRSSPLYKIFKDGVVRRVATGKKKGAITLDAIHAMKNDDGYSVIFDPVANGNFIQVFKYAFKCEDEDKRFMSYYNFVALQNGTYKKHFMQGYGDWRQLKYDEKIEEAFDEFFDVFKAFLWQVDRPESVNMTPDEALARMKEGEYTFITRSKLRKLLQEPSAQELLLHKDDFPPAPKHTFAFPDLGLAYDRYMRKKEQSRLFDTLQKKRDVDSGKNVIVLSAQQLDFLRDIF